MRTSRGKDHVGERLTHSELRAYVNVAYYPYPTACGYLFSLVLSLEGKCSESNAVLCRP